ncbi:MAG: flagellar hook-associated protein FlgK [Zoogloea sp.]|uniref:flagellar hook-associated protein FlgK n=1 Tax=Zoogloea sp. TaxID=49181 RepID=UPI00262B6B18|nr:flagellar hook-associated protein FlgK [Zoogloea sp.]MDD3328562.1 flagellar hook-associated protein FlgK [Zoogloea sp.]
MGASLFSIGLTGLNAAQAGLSTTSHNISNAGTTGYSRQRIEQSTNPAMFTGAGFFGEGTKVDTVKRAYNSFLTNQVLTADTKFNEYDTFSTEISQIDNMLADPTVGLSPALQDFFGGIEEVAANPASVPARQSMLSTAESLVSRMHNLSDRLGEIRAGVEGQIKETVSQISTYAKNIAEVNNKITIAQQAGSAQPANDLLDTRDQLVKELNQLVRVSTSTDADGSMSVFIGTGQPLVIGTTPTRLEALPSISEQSRLAVNILTQNGGAITIPESLLGGGKLGGLLNMRATALDSTQNQLGLIAIGLSTAFNAQHKLGQDLNGNPGTDFFTTPSVGVQRYANATTTTPDVQYGDISKLAGEDYRLTFTDTVGGYTLTRVSDGRSVSAADVGLSITPAATSWVGDSFLIQPTRNAASSLDVSIADTRMIAAGAPITAAATTSNLGTGSITAPVVSSTASIAAGVFGTSAAPLKLTHAGGSLTGFPATLPVTYTLLNSNPVTLAAPVASLPYQSGMTIQVGGVSFSISGALKDQDSFTLGPNAGGVSDSRNAVALGQLQTSKLMLSADGQPSATLQSVYSQLVSSVGNKAREVQVNRDAQESLVGQAYEAQQSIAGVNLDEEAANLIRYQQAYQASSKVMTIASKLFDEVLSLGR